MTDKPVVLIKHPKGKAQKQENNRRLRAKRDEMVKRQLLQERVAHWAKHRHPQDIFNAIVEGKIPGKFTFERYEKWWYAEQKRYLNIDPPAETDFLYHTLADAIKNKAQSETEPI